MKVEISINEVMDMIKAIQTKPEQKAGFRLPGRR